MTARRFAFTVRYRRRGWHSAQGRYFRDKAAAVRYWKKLLSGGRSDLAPIVEMRIERQELGPIEVVWKLDQE